MSRKLCPADLTKHVVPTTTTICNTTTNNAMTTMSTADYTQSTTTGITSVSAAPRLCPSTCLSSNLVSTSASHVPTTYIDDTATSTSLQEI
eukprot:2458463-Ditylum_brightwellii.AAC.1